MGKDQFLGLIFMLVINEDKNLEQVKVQNNAKYMLKRTLQAKS